MLAHTGQVAAVIDTWLQAEIVEADQGRNSYLSDFEAVDESTPMLLVNEAFLLQKAASHHGRFGRFVDTLTQYPEHDEAFAKVAFASLMFVSAGRRWEMLLQADDTGAYADLRRNAIGTSHDVDSLILNTYRELPPHTVEPITQATRLGSFTQYVKTTNEDILVLFTDTVAHIRATANSETDPAIAMQKKVQELGIVMAAQTIWLAAELRDGLEGVPLLEPKSITDANLYYPFRADIVEA